MALFHSSIVRNRLLSLLTDEDFALLEPKMVRVPMPLTVVLVAPHQPIHHVLFPERGIVSTVANTEEGRIEVGMIGREGVVGIPAILGVDSTPHTFLVQGTGEALRISTEDLRAAIQARPSIFRPLGLFVHTLMVQMGQTVYANVTFPLEGRLARWILMTQDRFEADDVLLTHEFLSTMLGVRRPSVTVGMQVLQGAGAIHATRGHILVRDREKLKEIAGDAYQVAEAEYERVMTRP